MPQIFKSKKFQAALLAIATAVFREFFPDVDETTVFYIVGTLIAYIGGQGLADFGKERKADETTNDG